MLVYLDTGFFFVCLFFSKMLILLFCSKQNVGTNFRKLKISPAAALWTNYKDWLACRGIPTTSKLL